MLRLLLDLGADLHEPGGKFHLTPLQDFLMSAHMTGDGDVLLELLDVLIAAGTFDTADKQLISNLAGGNSLWM